MAVSLLDNFSYNGKKPNFSRDLMPSIEVMRNYNENYLPPVFTALCEEDGKRYRYNVSNSVDPVLGKWRLDEGNSIDAYTKSETDTLLDKKADKEPFEGFVEVVKRLDGVVTEVGSVKYLDAQVYLESKGYTDEQIAKVNKKKSISCDEKPVYNSIDKTITYVKNGVSYTIEADEIWFYYMAESDLNSDNIISANETGLAQTIWIDGEEFTIMSFGLDMSEYVDKSVDVVSTYTGTETETDKIPDIKALQTMESMIDTKINEAKKAEEISYQNTAYPAQTNVKKALDAIWAKLDYVKPEISSFTMTPSATDYEVGQEVTALSFAWTYNKEVTSQSLTDVTLTDETDRSGSWSGSLTTSKTFTLTCSDGQNTATATKTISFKNKIYYGSAAVPETFDSAFILALSNKAFATSYKGKYNVTVGAGEYAFVCCPESWNMPNKCKIGGFSTDLVNAGNFSFTNASGGVTTYKIVRTSQAGLGAIEMLFE